MLYCKGRLKQQETFFRIAQIHATTVVLMHDHLVILGGLVAEERKFETVLAVQSAVAAPSVATHFCEDRQNVGCETLGDGSFRSLHKRRGSGADSLKCYVNWGGSVGVGSDNACRIDAGNRTFGGRELA